MVVDMNSVILDGRAELLNWQEDPPAITWLMTVQTDNGFFSIQCRAIGSLAVGVRDGIAAGLDLRDGRGRAMRVVGRLAMIDGMPGVFAEHVEMKPVAR